jgi:hypothetical protein
MPMGARPRTKFRQTKFRQVEPMHNDFACMHDNRPHIFLVRFAEPPAEQGATTWEAAFGGENRNNLRALVAPFLAASSAAKGRTGS